MLNRLVPSVNSAVLLVCGTTIFGFADSLTLLVSKDVSVGQFHFSRSLIAVIGIFVFSKVFGVSIMPRLWKPTVARTCFLVISALLYFASIPMMPMAVAGAGLFTSPIFVLLFSTLMFRERVGWRRISAVLLGSCGVLLVLQPGSDGFSVYQLMPVMAGACYAMTSIITYRYLQEESSLAILMSFLVALGFIGTLITVGATVFPFSQEVVERAPFLFKGWQSVDVLYWKYLAVIAATATIALLFITYAYQSLRTSYAAVFEYAYLFSVAFFGWLLWGNIPNFLSIIGIFLIIFAGLVISMVPSKYLSNLYDVNK